MKLEAMLARADKGGPVSSWCPELGPCWIWTGWINDAGYGCITLTRPRRVVRAHRRLYEFLVHAIDEDLELDHLCRVRCCVNPGHLEPVTRAINQQRGFGPCGINFRKTHCPKGHPYNDVNTYAHISGRTRRCRPCQAEAARLYRARKRG